MRHMEPRQTGMVFRYTSSGIRNNKRRTDYKLRIKMGDAVDTGAVPGGQVFKEDHWRERWGRQISYELLGQTAGSVLIDAGTDTSLGV